MITNLMRPIFDICEKEGIQVRQISMNHRSTPYAIIQDSVKYILLDSDADDWEKRLTLAHEFAHHIFGHLDSSKFKNGVLAPEYESEAQIFSVVYVAIALFFDTFFERYMSELQPTKDEK